MAGCIGDYIKDLDAMGLSATEMVSACLDKGLWSEREIINSIRSGTHKPKQALVHTKVASEPWQPSQEQAEQSSFRLPEPAGTGGQLAVEDAVADRIGYAFSPLVQCALPYRLTTSQANPEVPATSISKRAGGLSVTVGVVQRDSPVAASLSDRLPAHPFIPYGGLTRLLLTYMAMHVIRTGSPEVDLTSGASFLLGRLKISPTFGQRGSVQAAMAQIDGLRNTYISSEFEGRTADTSKTVSWKNMFLMESGDLWFSANYQSTSAWLKLSPLFAEALGQHAFPIDLYTLRSLYDSPIAMDVYTWLSYHSATLRRPVEFTWKQIHASSGSTSTNIRAFKQDYLKAMKLVRGHYDGWRAEVTEKGLLVSPGKPHVKRRTQGVIT